MTCKAVVFDIGNVLLRWNPEAFYDRTIGEERRRALFQDVPLMRMNEEVDRGADLQQSAQTLAQQHPEYGDAIMLFATNWEEMIGPAIDRSLHLMRALRRKGTPVFALSNFGKDTFLQAQQSYPFLEEFDRAFISGRLEMIKPEAEIYAHLEAETGLSAEALFLTDDMPANIAAAAERGWITHLFEGGEGLSKALISHGLLTREEAE